MAFECAPDAPGGRCGSLDEADAAVMQLAAALASTPERFLVVLVRTDPRRWAPFVI
jgi:hypothetical protein